MPQDPEFLAAYGVGFAPTLKKSSTTWAYGVTTDPANMVRATCDGYLQARYPDVAPGSFWGRTPPVAAVGGAVTPLLLIVDVAAAMGSTAAVASLVSAATDAVGVVTCLVSATSESTFRVVVIASSVDALVAVRESVAAVAAAGAVGRALVVHGGEEEAAAAAAVSALDAAGVPGVRATALSSGYILHPAADVAWEK